VGSRQPVLPIICDSSCKSIGTVGCLFFLNRLAMVIRVTPNTQAPNGASERNDSREAKMLVKTSWTISSTSARLLTRRSTKR